jgi:hypothetical protein
MHLLIFVTKTIGDNYRIYNLIIILNAKIVVNVRCGLFKMSSMSHLTMFLPSSGYIYKSLSIRPTCH